MLRCCNYALGKLAKVAIGRASNVVMQVMKLGHARVARLQHLKENLRCNRLDVLGREAVKVAIHQAPPCPEAVRWVRPAHFGQARHRPLKRVAVQVHRRRQKQIHRAVTGSALRNHSRDSPIQANMNSTVLRPALRRKHLFRMNNRHRSASPKLVLTFLCSYILMRYAANARSHHARAPCL